VAETDAIARVGVETDPSVTVTVKNGVVRLTGTVPSGTRRLDAAVLARSIQGVRAVKDELRLATAKG
jgi:osmotically-inducible protein OsmY